MTEILRLIKLQSFVIAVTMVVLFIPIRVEKILGGATSFLDIAGLAGYCSVAATNIAFLFYFLKKKPATDDRTG